jgi:hypothetical protein
MNADDEFRKQFEELVAAFFAAPEDDRESYLEQLASDLVFIEFLLEKWKP